MASRRARRRKKNEPSVFGLNLKRAREDAGLRKCDLSRLSSEQAGLIHALEAGAIAEPTASRAKHLEEALGLPPYSLLREPKQAS